MTYTTKKALYKKRWKKENTEKVREYSRKYRAKNKEKIQNWRKENRHKSREYEREYRKTPKGKYREYKKSAKQRNHNFDLTFEQFSKFLFSLNSKCYYCGTKKHLGIDRKINLIGYVNTNCVACCWQCNKLKGKMLNNKQFIRLCISVAKNNPQPQR